MKDYNSNKDKGLPPSWRVFQRRLPKTLSTFQIAIAAGFLSLLILRSTIGFGSLKSSTQDNSEMDGYLGDEPKFNLDLDIEPKRNLAQVKIIEMEHEKSQQEVEETTETGSTKDEVVELPDEMIEEPVSGNQVVLKPEHELEEQISENQVEDFEMVVEPESLRNAVQKPAHEIEERLSENQVEIFEKIKQEAQMPDVVKNFKDVEARLAKAKSEEFKAEFEEETEEPNVAENRDPQKTPEEIFRDLHRQAIENMTRLTSDVSDQFSLGPKISDWDEQRASWLEMNPHMITTDPHKPKVLLITGSQPLPCKSPVGDHYLLKMLKNKVDYARIHKLDIFYNFAHLDKPMSHYWAKLPLIRKMMLMHPEAEWIFWMDSDAMFTDMVFEVPFESYDEYNIVMWGYNFGIYEQRSWVACNTGVFFLRNNQWTLDLLDIWALMGPEGEIRNEAGKILTSYLTSRPEMMADDQSALVFLMLTKEELRPKIYLEWDYWLSGYWADIVDKYEEFAEKSRPGAGGDKWPFTTHFTGCQPCSGVFNPMYEGNMCLDGMERAFNFADNQVLRSFGFEHESLKGATVRRIRNETTHPLSSVPTDNPWSVGAFY